MGGHSSHEQSSALDRVRLGCPAGHIQRWSTGVFWMPRGQDISSSTAYC